MRLWAGFLMVSLLQGQASKPAASLKLPPQRLTPQDILRAMVAVDQARRIRPGATVEVLGYDDEAALKLLSLGVAQQVRASFRPMDKRGHQELYAFIRQGPSHPSPVWFVPLFAGGKQVRAEDKWLK